MTDMIANLFGKLFLFLIDDAAFNKRILGHRSPSRRKTIHGTRIVCLRT
jgi:hypothetical protein